MTITVGIDQTRKAILALPTMDADAKQLESQYPGIYAAMLAAAEPEMRRYAEAKLPAYWTALERMYIARLTEREAQAVLVLFRSPTGQKFLQGTYAAMDTGPMVAEMVKTDSVTVDAKQMQTAVDVATAKAAGQMGPEDKARFATLAASIDFVKFRELGAETQKITLEWVTKSDPEGEEKVNKIMQDAMERYIAAHHSKK